ncbi:Protein mab-21, partial [Fragariocoptes setiger]
MALETRLSNQEKLFIYQLQQFDQEKVAYRRQQINKTIGDIKKIVHDILKEVELQEPRFISTLSNDCTLNGHFEAQSFAAATSVVGPTASLSHHSHAQLIGHQQQLLPAAQLQSDHQDTRLDVISANEFEVVLYLNQMGVFNFVDDGSLPGCAVLKLSDGRKRSMSLWVEFITASGYLSARKIRSRFQTLVAQACDKCSYRDIVRLVPDTSEVKLRINDRYVVQITPAFRCNGLWPRSASHWPSASCPWPPAGVAAEVKAEGFDLLSKESLSSQKGKQSAMEGDAWMLSFTEAENRLLQGASRKKCLSILKTLRDRNLDTPGNPITSYHLKTLLLYECEKHPHDYEWDDTSLGDRINGILLQLISCIQCRRCPHYFLPNLDLFRGRNLDNAAKQTWRLMRSLLTDPTALERL